MSDTPSPKADRNLAFDVVKGVGILEVVIHHSLGQSARIFSEKGDWAWTTMRAIAWSTNFAIPLFLLLSAMLLAGSLAKNPGIGRFVWRRGSRTLWPYLLWTAIYLVFGALTLRTLELDTTRLLDPERLQRAVLWGKASYHLYFLVILLQLSLALPFVVLALKRVRLSFAWILLLSFLLQFGAFMLQKHVLRSAYPATLLLWYVPSLLIGAWIGLNRDEWRTTYARWWPTFLTVGILGSALFAWMNVDSELGQPWDGTLYNWTSVVFRLSASLALLGFAPRFAETWIGPFLAALGRYSLPIYLIHPVILRLLGGVRVTGWIAWLPAPAFWTILVVTAVSYGIAWLLSLMRLDFVLFGQPLPRRTPPNVSPAAPV